MISIELSRNCDRRSGEYRYDLAQKKYEKRLHSKPKFLRFTAVDRVTRLVWIELLEGKEAAPLKELIKTITADNGKEFAEHKAIAEGLNIENAEVN